MKKSLFVLSIISLSLHFTAPQARAEADAPLVGSDIVCKFDLKEYRICQISPGHEYENPIEWNSCATGHEDTGRRVTHFQAVRIQHLASGEAKASLTNDKEMSIVGDNGAFSGGRSSAFWDPTKQIQSYGFRNRISSPIPPETCGTGKVLWDGLTYPNMRHSKTVTWVNVSLDQPAQSEVTVDYKNWYSGILTWLPHRFYKPHASFTRYPAQCEISPLK